jgi:hypothetical protein
MKSTLHFNSLTPSQVLYTVLEAGPATVAHPYRLRFELACCLLMPDRPTALETVDLHLLAARIAHEYAADRHHELVQLEADNQHTRKLLNESAALALHDMPYLARQLRALQRDWEEQHLLDPEQAQRTARSLEDCWIDLAPRLQVLRDRQDATVAQLVDLLRNPQPD